MLAATQDGGVRFQPGTPWFPRQAGRPARCAGERRWRGQFREVTLPGSRAPAPASIVSRPLATVAEAADGGCRKPSLLSPGCRAARGCVCYLPPPSLPPRHSLPRQQLGEALRGEETGGTTPHIPCKAAPVLRWPCHLLPDLGPAGSLGHSVRRGAGTRGASWPGAGKLGLGPCADTY